MSVKPLYKRIAYQTDVYIRSSTWFYSTFPPFIYAYSPLASTCFYHGLAMHRLSNEWWCRPSKFKSITVLFWFTQHRLSDNLSGNRRHSFHLWPVDTASTCICNAWSWEQYRSHQDVLFTWSRKWDIIGISIAWIGRDRHSNSYQLIFVPSTQADPY